MDSIIDFDNYLCLTDDLEELKRIKKDAISVCENYTNDNINTWLKFITNDETPFYGESIYIYKIDNIIIGFITYTINKEENYGKIENLFILKKNHGKSYGKHLLEKAEKKIFNCVNKILIRGTLNAQAFYENNGYSYSENAKSKIGFEVALLEKNKNKGI